MTTSPTISHRPNRALHVALWIVQVLLGAMFGAAGAMKLTVPIAELAQQLPWTGALPEPMVRFIGASEFAGALGLILPAATRIRPALTGWAGVGLATVMTLAMAFHLSRGEAGALPINLTLGGLAAFVAWGRLRKAPIHPRA